MEAINELEVRDLLERKLSPEDRVFKIVRQLADATKTWEEKRPMWHLLFNTTYLRTLAECLQEAFESKQRVPFELLLQISNMANLMPNKAVVDSVLKGLKKQKSFEDIINSRGWDRWSEKFTLIRAELVERKLHEQVKFKENLKEKFEFLKNQRMSEQAGRVLKRMLELFPEDAELYAIKRDFDEQWARDVLATHIATIQAERLDRTTTQPSNADQVMLQSFLLEGEKAAFDKREFALDLSIAFWFLEDYNRALDILAWAPSSAAADWMRAELLFASRRFVEALEQLNQLEIKYIAIPETTFSVSYLRAQCLNALGQQTSALEIMQSIVRVRSQYRSAHALILEWTAGVSWE